MTALQTKTQLKQIRTDLDLALAEVAKKHGLKDLHTGNAGFTEGGSFTFKIHGILAGGLSEEAQRYNELRDLLKLPELGSLYEASNGKKYTITGINTTGTKVFIQDENGETYNTKVEALNWRISKQVQS